MDVRTNAGYIITDSIHIGDVEFVLGVSREDVSMFVTWECVNGGGYCHGHYMDDLLEAQQDLLKRAGQELAFQRRLLELRKERPKERESER
ncbi:MAG: hypothetical protein HFF09_07955 [Oscillospiraceae bacterium]|nr:hypothetical protein [Oscillospiraceae bacterium]